MSNAIVTGGAGGIGGATVHRLLRDGFSVAAVDINADRLRKLEKDAPAPIPGARFATYQADLIDEAAARAVVKRIEDEMGAVDVLVNTVGWTGYSRFVEEGSDYWRRLATLNFESVLYVTHAVLPGMQERRSGKIITVSSDAGRVGQSGQAVYSGMKGALIAWSKAVAREVARYGISVNCTAPGPTLTPLLGEDVDPDNGPLIRHIPFRRLAQPSEQASVIAFLASDDASYITGQVISVSAGLTMV
jgi:2-hydroxycyclohexanecarboxyl-CoA dehydrogenase